MRKFIIITFSIFCCASLLLAETDTLRVMTYSVLRYDGAEDDQPRIADFQLIIGEINPDILVCQDIGDSAGAYSFWNDILDPEVYGMAAFIDIDGENDNVLFFNREKFTALEPDTLATDLRYITVFPLTYNVNESQPIIHIASAYLKGSDSPDDRQRRLDEVNVLLNYLADQEIENPYFLLCGVLNFRDSDEDGYNALVGDEQFYDPLDSPGNWHDSEEFAFLHTQSTRTEQFGGGASGGCDDRFDFILPLVSFETAEGWTYLPDSYTTFGNDGQHLNISINDGENSAVSEEVANALYDASDHLPVYMDFTYYIEEDNDVPLKNDLSAREFSFAEVYPNPFNNTAKLRFELVESGFVRLGIFNLKGNLVTSLYNGFLKNGSYSYSLNSRDITTGIYFARLVYGKRTETVKMTLIR